MFKEYFEANRVARIEASITEILDNLAVPQSFTGYTYLKAAIFMAVEDFSTIDAMNKIMYPSVAKQHKTLPSRVASAISRAISAAWDRGDIDMLNSYFGYTLQNNRGKPTNSEFIALIADRILLELENDPLKKDVTQTMHRLGVPANIRGYSYLREAILLTVKDSDIITSVTSVLYPSLARQYTTTAARVECAIRHAIEVAWDRGDVDTINSYFGYMIMNSFRKPTNSEFIAMIADDMRLKYRLKYRP